jgi:hypothetical protein
MTQSVEDPVFLSTRYMIEVRLEDFIQSVSKLLSKLASPGFGVQSSSTASAALNSNARINSMLTKNYNFIGGDEKIQASSLEDSISELIKCDQLLQSAVDQLIQEQKKTLELEELKKKIKNVDVKIADFAKDICNLEHEIYSKLVSPGTDSHARDWDGSIFTGKQSFSVKEVTVLAERLALTSAPPDFTECAGLALNRPPAPQEDLMSASLLHASVKELLELAALEASQKEAADQDYPVSVAQANLIAAKGERKTFTIDAEKIEEIYEKLERTEDMDEEEDFDPELLDEMWRQLNK